MTLKEFLELNENRGDLIDITIWKGNDIVDFAIKSDISNDFLENKVISFFVSEYGELDIHIV